MPRRVHTYNFARLNLIGSINESNQEFILSGLVADVYEQLGKFRYLIADVEEVEVEGQVFAFGFVVKYKYVLEGELVDEEEKRIVEGGLPLGIVAKSKFFLHYSSSILAYRPISSRLSAKQFRMMFSRLIEAGHQSFFVSVKLDTIDEEIDIQNAIDELLKVQRVSINLHPTNPSNRQVYDQLDSRLKRLEAQKLRQELDGGEQGLNKEALKNDDAYHGIVMATDGYGDAEVNGVASDGRSVTIRTTDSPVTQRAADSENPQNILYSLLATFRRIGSRITDDDSR